ncbi:hypothetical protein B0H13DRAFT_2400574 [Mycena leptocephala]|nr:hypothetical protein B0H13DRAFT_2400574 [Mycena leptocephala]
MSSRMPPELSDCIIDFLWDSQPGLRACSLVCSKWLPSSRHHLFDSITIRPDLRFLTLFQSPGNVVSNYTRILDFRLWSPEIEAAIPAMLHNLPNFLRLRTITIGSFPPSPRDFPILPEAVELSLQHTKFASRGDFAQLLSKFTGLRELELGSITWGDRGDLIWPCIL